MNNKPVAWAYIKDGEFWDAIHPDEYNKYEVTYTTPLYTHPVKELTDEDAKQKLIRIMGTFDLATGHADTFDELLDSLKVELRDVLGYYREALRKAQEK